MTRAEKYRTIDFRFSISSMLQNVGGGPQIIKWRLFDFRKVEGQKQNTNFPWILIFLRRPSSLPPTTQSSLPQPPTSLALSWLMLTPQPIPFSWIEHIKMSRTWFFYRYSRFNEANNLYICSACVCFKVQKRSWFSFLAQKYVFLFVQIKMMKECWGSSAFPLTLENKWRSIFFTFNQSVV